MLQFSKEIFVSSFFISRAIFQSLWLHVVAGLYGPVTFAMCVIGVEMMMEVMVSPLQIYLCIELYAYFSSFRNFPFFYCSGYCAVVLFRSREHENCGPQPGYVRAHVESKLYVNSLVVPRLER